MLRIVIASSVMFLLSFATAAQTSNRDRARLREHLNLPPATVIAQSDSPALPDSATLKVYLAMGNDQKAYKRFSKWADEWNRENGAKYGKLEIVPALSNADVIMARFNVREHMPRPRTTVSVGPVHDPTGDRNASTPKVSTRLYAPVARHAYLITRSEDALFILYDDVDRTHISEYSDPDKDLFDELKKRLKNR